MRNGAQLVFNDPKFVDMKLQTLSALLNENHLNVGNEVDIYKAVVKWADSECKRQRLKSDGKNQRKVLGTDILHKIRFLSFTHEQFAEVVGDSDVLTPEEKLMVYNCLIRPEKYVPRGVISANRNARSGLKRTIDWSSRLQENRGQGHQTYNPYGYQTHDSNNSSRKNSLLFLAKNNFILRGFLCKSIKICENCSYDCYGRAETSKQLSTRPQITVQLKSQPSNVTTEQIVMKKCSLIIDLDGNPSRSKVVRSVKESYYDNVKPVEFPVPIALTNGMKYILEIEERNLFTAYRLTSQPSEEILNILSSEIYGISGFIISEFN